MKDACTSVPSRREARRLSRRDAILDVAAQSFLELGYAGTSMSAVAATVGGSKATMWGYFPSKEHLFAAAIERESAQFRAKLTPLLNTEDKLEVALQKFTLEFLRKVTSPRALALHRLVISAAIGFPEAGKIFYEVALKPTHALLGDFLSAAMARGQLREDEPFVAARTLTSLCMAVSHQRLIMGVIPSISDEEIVKEATRATDVFLRAFQL